MIAALIRYPGSARGPSNRGLDEKLSPAGEARALDLFRAKHDTVSIAVILRCQLAAAANGLANARERERGQ